MRRLRDSGHTSATTPASTLRANAVARAGFRRVSQVEICVGPGLPAAVVHGVVHRYPGTFEVSLATANQLADAGVPMVVTDHHR